MKMITGPDRMNVYFKISLSCPRCSIGDEASMTYAVSTLKGEKIEGAKLSKRENDTKQEDPSTKPSILDGSESRKDEVSLKESEIRCTCADHSKENGLIHCGKDETSTDCCSDGCSESEISTDYSDSWTESDTEVSSEVSSTDWDTETSSGFSDYHGISSGATSIEGEKCDTEQGVLIETFKETPDICNKVESKSVKTGDTIIRSKVAKFVEDIHEHFGTTSGLRSDLQESSVLSSGIKSLIEETDLREDAITLEDMVLACTKYENVSLANTTNLESVSDLEECRGGIAVCCKKDSRASENSAESSGIKPLVEETNLYGDAVTLEEMIIPCRKDESLSLVNRTSPELVCDLEECHGGITVCCKEDLRESESFVESSRIESVVKKTNLYEDAVTLEEMIMPSRKDESVPRANRTSPESVCDLEECRGGITVRCKEGSRESGPFVESSGIESLVEETNLYEDAVTLEDVIMPCRKDESMSLANRTSSKSVLDLEECHGGIAVCCKENARTSEISSTMKTRVNNVSSKPHEWKEISSKKETGRGAEGLTLHSASTCHVRDEQGEASERNSFTNNTETYKNVGVEEETCFETNTELEGICSIRWKLPTRCMILKRGCSEGWGRFFVEFQQLNVTESSDSDNAAVENDQPIGNGFKNANNDDLLNENGYILPVSYNCHRKASASSEEENIAGSNSDSEKMWKCNKSSFVRPDKMQKEKDLSMFSRKPSRRRWVKPQLSKNVLENNESLKQMNLNDLSQACGDLLATNEQKQIRPITEGKQNIETQERADGYEKTEDCWSDTPHRSRGRRHCLSEDCHNSSRGDVTVDGNTWTSHLYVEPCDGQEWERCVEGIENGKQCPGDSVSFSENYDDSWSEPDWNGRRSGESVDYHGEDGNNLRESPSLDRNGWYSEDTENKESCNKGFGSPKSSLDLWRNCDKERGSPENSIDLRESCDEGWGSPGNSIDLGWVCDERFNDSGWSRRHSEENVTYFDEDWSNPRGSSSLDRSGWNPEEKQKRLPFCERWTIPKRSRDLEPNYHEGWGNPVNSLGLGRNDCQNWMYPTCSENNIPDCNEIWSDPKESPRSGFNPKCIKDKSYDDGWNSPENSLRWNGGNSEENIASCDEEWGNSREPENLVADEWGSEEPYNEGWNTPNDWYSQDNEDYNSPNEPMNSGWHCDEVWDNLREPLGSATNDWSPEEIENDEPCSEGWNSPDVSMGLGENCDEGWSDPIWNGKCSKENRMYCEEDWGAPKESVLNWNRSCPESRNGIPCMEDRNMSEESSGFDCNRDEVWSVLTWNDRDGDAPKSRNGIPCIEDKNMSEESSGFDCNRDEDWSVPAWDDRCSKEDVYHEDWCEPQEWNDDLFNRMYCEEVWGAPKSRNGIPCIEDRNMPEESSGFDCNRDEDWSVPAWNDRCSEEDVYHHIDWCGPQEWNDNRPEVSESAQLCLCSDDDQTDEELQDLFSDDRRNNSDSRECNADDGESQPIQDITLVLHSDEDFKETEDAINYESEENLQFGEYCEDPARWPPQLDDYYCEEFASSEWQNHGGSKDSHSIEDDSDQNNYPQSTTSYYFDDDCQSVASDFEGKHVSPMSETQVFDYGCEEESSEEEWFTGGCEDRQGDYEPKGDSHDNHFFDERKHFQLDTEMRDVLPYELNEDIQPTLLDRQDRSCTHSKGFESSRYEEGFDYGYDDLPNEYLSSRDQEGLFLNEHTQLNVGPGEADVMVKGPKDLIGFQSTSHPETFLAYDSQGSFHSYSDTEEFFTSDCKGFRQQKDGEQFGYDSQDEYRLESLDDLPDSGWINNSQSGYDKSDFQSNGLSEGHFELECSSLDRVSENDSGHEKASNGRPLVFCSYNYKESDYSNKDPEEYFDEPWRDYDSWNGSEESFLPAYDWNGNFHENDEAKDVRLGFSGTTNEEEFSVFSDNYAKASDLECGNGLSSWDSLDSSATLDFPEDFYGEGESEYIYHLYSTETEQDDGISGFA